MRGIGSVLSAQEKDQGAGRKFGLELKHFTSRHLDDGRSNRHHLRRRAAGKNEAIWQPAGNGIQLPMSAAAFKSVASTISPHRRCAAHFKLVMRSAKTNFALADLHLEQPKAFRCARR